VLLRAAARSTAHTPDEILAVIKTFKKLLVANRSEIAIRVFRSAHELGIKTVAIYSHEDRFALHRFKADEAYQIGKAGEPIRAYLDIDGIIDIAKAHDVDVIHPGYGFLSENPELARACERAGITFCGPSPEILDKLGDKITARTIARAAGVPVLSGSNEPLKNADEARALAETLGYPVLLKAAKGGGGRGMRVVPKPEDLANALEQAQRESLNAFGSTDVFLEKFIQRPRHIEVQLMGDKHGRLVHLFERDCSLQRRHQKVVEIAPSPNLDERLRDDICQAALAVGHSVNYQSAGTVEFLVDSDTDKFYFIEVNPRIQVEHTCTEQVTGVDLIRSADSRRARSHACRPADRPAVAREDSHQRLRHPVPRDDGRPAQQVLAGLRAAVALSLVGRPGRSARCRHRFFRRGRHAVLRLAVGEGHHLRSRIQRSRRPHGALLARVPHPRREDEHSVLDQPRHARQVSRRPMHDAVP
jgi:D-alanine-D-alanine ligase-like ATP-grasp enzyme